MKKIAIIPARSGSKRIPKKNIKLFLGKPIISYPILAAKKSNLFDEILVSTDDIEIGQIAQKFGATFRNLRSAKNSRDHSTTFDVIEEELKYYKEQDINLEYACCIYPTAVFISENLLQNSLKVLRKGNYDSVFPITEYTHPIERSMQLFGNKVVFNFEENNLKRTQDFNTSYHDTGQFYWLNPERILDKKKIITNNSSAIILNKNHVHDIDNLVDWNIAENKFKNLRKK